MSNDVDNAKTCLGYTIQPKHLKPGQQSWGWPCFLSS